MDDIEILWNKYDVALLKLPGQIPIGHVPRLANRKPGPGETLVVVGFPYGESNGTFRSASSLTGVCKQDKGNFQLKIASGQGNWTQNNLVGFSGAPVLTADFNMILGVVTEAFEHALGFVPLSRLFLEEECPRALLAFLPERKILRSNLTTLCAENAEEARALANRLALEVNAMVDQLWREDVDLGNLLRGLCQYHTYCLDVRQSRQAVFVFAVVCAVAPLWFWRFVKTTYRDLLYGGEGVTMPADRYLVEARMAALARRMICWSETGDYHQPTYSLGFPEEGGNDIAAILASFETVVCKWVERSDRRRAKAALDASRERGEYYYALLGAEIDQSLVAQLRDAWPQLIFIACTGEVPAAEEHLVTLFQRHLKAGLPIDYATAREYLARQHGQTNSGAST